MKKVFMIVMMAAFLLVSGCGGDDPTDIDLDKDINEYDRDIIPEHDDYKPDSEDDTNSETDLKPEEGMDDEPVADDCDFGMYGRCCGKDKYYIYDIDEYTWDGEELPENAGTLVGSKYLLYGGSGYMIDGVQYESGSDVFDIIDGVFINLIWKETPAGGWPVYCVEAFEIEKEDYLIKQGNITEAFDHELSLGSFDDETYEIFVDGNLTTLSDVEVFGDLLLEKGWIMYEFVDENKEDSYIVDSDVPAAVIISVRELPYYDYFMYVGDIVESGNHSLTLVEVTDQGAVKVNVLFNETHKIAEVSGTDTVNGLGVSVVEAFPEAGKAVISLI